MTTLRLRRVLGSALLSVFAAHGTPDRADAALCTMDPVWAVYQTLGSPGSLDLWTSALVTNPVDDTIWFLAQNYDPATGLVKADTYRVDETLGFAVLDNSWQHPDPTRLLYPYLLTADSDGELWVGGVSSDANGADYRLFLRKRDINGVWHDIVTAWQYLGGQEIGFVIGAMSNRYDEIWMTGWVLELDQRYTWTTWRYTKSTDTLTSMPSGPTTGLFAGLGVGNDPEPLFIKPAPDGKMWIGGRAEDVFDDTHGVVLVENASSTGFDLAVDYRYVNGYDGRERIRDVAFDGSGGVWMVHSYQSDPVDQAQLSQILYSPSYVKAHLFSVVENGYVLQGGYTTVQPHILWSRYTDSAYTTAFSFKGDSNTPADWADLFRDQDGPGFKTIQVQQLPPDRAGTWATPMMTMQWRSGTLWGLSTSFDPLTVTGAQLTLYRRGCN